jgi:uncharacterized membrane protein
LSWARSLGLVASVGSIDNTQTMRDMPPQNLYHRWLGWHALDLRRTAVVLAVGAVVTGVVRSFAGWRLGLVVGWDACALTFLLSTGPIVARADGARTHLLATREDPTRVRSTALLVAACLASLAGVGFALHLAGGESGPLRGLLIGLGVLTVGLSWTVANVLYTLRYAHLHFASAPAGIRFGGPDQDATPTYRDFAYVAFTIGMCYQVSDTTLAASRIRRAALVHAALSYVFGVVIIAGSVNLISGLLL